MAKKIKKVNAKRPGASFRPGRKPGVTIEPHVGRR